MCFKINGIKYLQLVEEDFYATFMTISSIIAFFTEMKSCHYIYCDERRMFNVSITHVFQYFGNACI